LVRLLACASAAIGIPIGGIRSMQTGSLAITEAECAAAYRTFTAVPQEMSVYVRFVERGRVVEP